MQITPLSERVKNKKTMNPKPNTTILKLKTQQEKIKNKKIQQSQQLKLPKIIIKITPFSIKLMGIRERRRKENLGKK